MTSTAYSASAQLRDVLQETEDAVLIILEAANTIDTAIDTTVLSPEFRKMALEQLSHIYTACGFQDTSSQRIKNVLQLLDTSCGTPDSLTTKDSLLNGPQPLAAAPTQSDIDQLFRKG